jgi:dienelactone hydrolase
MTRWSAWVAIVLVAGCTPGGSDGRATTVGGTSGSQSSASETAENEASDGTGGETQGEAESGTGTGVEDTGDTGGPAGTLRLDLAGHALDGYPHFRRVQNFNDDEAIEIAVDPTRAPELVGETCDVFVVEARSAEAWEQDGTLVDVRAGGPQAFAIGGALADNRVGVAGAGELGSEAGAGLGVAYDVVLDCNANGVLDDGDAIDGGSAPGLWRTHDTTRPGPLPVTMFEDSGGSFLAQRTFHPANIDAMGEVPLVVVTHGWSYTHTYYDYIGEHLASYGYVVMFHEAEVQDGGPSGTIAAGDTTLENTDWLLANLGTTGGGVLEGHVDARRIMFTGHSTGGEAVVRAVTRLRDGSFTSPHFDYDDVRIVSSMAPVSWHPRGQVDPGDVAYHIFLAGADDDVSGAPEAWYTQPLSIYERATGERQVTYIHGAGHGDLLSCCGELYIDASAPDLIGREETNRVARGYFLALAELYLRDNEAAREFFTRRYADYHPSGIAGHVVVTNEHRAARVGSIVLDDFEGDGDLERSSSGGAVSFDVANAAEVLMRDNDGSLAWAGTQPSNGMTRARHQGDDPHAMVFDWSPGAPRFYEQEIAAPLRDFTGHAFLSFRAAQGTRHPETVALAGPLSFTVTLRDEAGAASSIAVSGDLAIPPPYPRDGFGAGAGWQNEFVTVRLRLSDFAVDGDLDLARIEAIRLDFGEGFGSARGRLALDDLELTSR